MLRCCRGRWRERARRLWTPALLRPELWLDAADLSTITIATGVSEWRDKSPNVRHAATTVRKPELLLNAQNGLSAIKFTKNSATKLDTPDFSIAPNRKFCTFVVASGAGLISSSTYPRIWVAKGAGDAAALGSTYQQGYLGAGGSNGSAAFLAGATSPIAPELTGISTTLPVLLTGRFGTAGLAADNISLAINGGAQTYASGRTGSLSTTGIRVGSDVSAQTTSSWDSWIGEVVLTLDISFRLSQIIEGYLAWKWGLAQYLPVSHPFKLRPPLEGD